MNIGYIHSWPNISNEEQRYLIAKLSELLGVKIDAMYYDADIEMFTTSVLSDGDVLIVSEISCLGSKLQAVNDKLRYLVNRKIKVCSAKEGYIFDQNSLDIIDGIDMAIKIRQSMHSSVTKMALQECKRKGMVLRPRVGGSKSTIFDEKKDLIIKMFHEEKTKEEIAKALGCAVSTLFKYLRDHPEIKKIKDKDGNLVEHILPRRRASKFDKYKDVIIKMYHEGKTKKQIADAVGLSQNMIFRYLNMYPEIKEKTEKSND
jgi:DNA invertase Pin-like site-specific DNA recombinase